MRIDRLELRLLRLPLVRHFETSFGRVHERVFLLVTVEGEGAVGVGECVADANPYYSAETTRTAWHIISEFLAPLVLGRAFDDPREIYAAFAAVRGHQMAKAAVEMAAWDLAARQRGVSLSTLLAVTDARSASGPRTSIESGVSIGIQDSLDELVERVAVERAAGYRRVKIKIKPGWDIEAVERIRERFGDIPLMVDANAAYTLEDAARLAELDRFDLMMIEQPLDYDDIRDHARLQRRPPDARSASTSRFTRSRSRQRRSSSARAGSSTSSPAGSAGTRSRCACTIWRPRTAYRSGTAACSRAASAGRTTSTSRRCRIFRCRATSPPAAATMFPT